MQIDTRLLKYGYAPGGYSFNCCRCRGEFIDGDKRCVTCKKCAEELLARDAMQLYNQTKDNKSKMNFEVYSKDNCIYCTKIKELLVHHGLKYEEKSLSNGYTKEDIQTRVGDAKTINTVPQVFVNNEYLGGYLEVVEFIAYDRHLGISEKV